MDGVKAGPVVALCMPETTLVGLPVLVEALCSVDASLDHSEAGVISVITVHLRTHEYTFEHTSTPAWGASAPANTRVHLRTHEYTCELASAPANTRVHMQTHEYIYELASTLVSTRVYFRVDAVAEHMHVSSPDVM